MNYSDVLRNSNFIKLWGSQILSQVAQNLLNFALIIQVFNAAAGTSFANASVGLLVLAFGLPSILFAAAAGAKVDVWDRRTVMIITNAMRAILAIVFLLFDHNLILILILTFAISSITQFFMPAEAASIPTVVDKTQLLAANSLMVFSLYASFIGGYALAAPIIQLFGEGAPYIATAIMFGIATIMDILLPKNKVITNKIVNQSQSMLEQLKESYRLIKNDKWLKVGLRQLTISQALVSIILSLGPALSLALLHKPLQNAGLYLIVPAGIGMVLGVVLIGRLTKRWSKIHILEVGLVLAGLALVLLGLSGFLYETYDGHSIVPYNVISIIVAILLFALGMLNAIISATAQTVLQENSTDATRGKIFGSLNMMINIAATLPILITGVLADLISVTNVIVVMGVIAITFGFINLSRLKRNFG